MKYFCGNFHYIFRVTQTTGNTKCFLTNKTTKLCNGMTDDFVNDVKWILIQCYIFACKCILQGAGNK
jgi:hypothetical protein